jgi:NAD(P)H-flavin reductase
MGINNNFVIIDKRKEKREIKYVMIDETMMIKYATDNMLNNKIKLLYSNRNSMFLYKDELDMLSSMNKNINIVYTVTGSDLEWKGRFGHIDEDMIKEYCDLDSLFLYLWSS